jgi:hypothetical protein
MRRLVWLLVFLAGLAGVVFWFRKLGAPSPVPQPVVAVPPSNAPSPAPVPPPLPALASNGVLSSPPPFVPPAVFTPTLSNLVDRRLDYVERVRILTSGRLTEVKDPQDLATLATEDRTNKLHFCPGGAGRNVA